MGGPRPARQPPPRPLPTTGLACGRCYSCGNRSPRPAKGQAGRGPWGGGSQPVNCGSTAAREQRRAGATSVREGAPLRNVIRVVTFCTAGPWRRSATSALTFLAPLGTFTVFGRRPLTEKRTRRIELPVTVMRACTAAQPRWAYMRTVGELTRSPCTWMIEVADGVVAGAGAGAGVGAGAGAGAASGAGAGAQWTTVSASGPDDSGRVSPFTVPAGPHHENALTSCVSYSVKGTLRCPSVPPASLSTNVPCTKVASSTVMR